MVSDLKILAGSAAAIAALLCPEYASIQCSSRRLLMTTRRRLPSNTEDGGFLAGSDSGDDRSHRSLDLGNTMPNGGSPDSPRAQPRTRPIKKSSDLGGTIVGLGRRKERSETVVSARSYGGESLVGFGHANAEENENIYSLSRILRRRKEKIKKLCQGSNEVTEAYSSNDSDTKDAEANKVSSNAMTCKMAGYVSLLTGLTFAVFSMNGIAPFGLDPTGMILIIGICITVGLVTQFMGNKFATLPAVASFLLVGGAGFAFTYSSLLAHTAETDVALLHLSNIFMTCAAFGALAFALFYMAKRMGGLKFLKVMFREGLRLESAGLTGVALALTGLAICTIPKAISGETAAWTPVVTLASLCTLWVGLAIFAYSFLQNGKLGMDGRPSWWLRTASVITLAAGGAAVAGVGIQLYGGEAAHMGTQLLQYGGIAFVALFATMCIYFSFKFCKAGKNLQ